MVTELSVIHAALYGAVLIGRYYKKSVDRPLFAKFHSNFGSKCGVVVNQLNVCG